MHKISNANMTYLCSAVHAAELPSKVCRKNLGAIRSSDLAPMLIMAVDQFACGKLLFASTLIRHTIDRY